MKNYYLPLWAALCSFSSLFAQNHVLTVNGAYLPPFDHPDLLVKEYFAGTGIAFLSVESSPNPYSFGYFTDGDDAVGLNRGIIMSTGAAVSASDFGADQSSESLNQNTPIPELTEPFLFDIVYIRIKFKPLGDSIVFRYVFGSEEYPEFSCSPFNDAFGFFLSGPKPGGGTYNALNIAHIPGTNLPVTINNCHPYNSAYPNCFPVNAQYYHDNYGALDKQPVYDGFLDVFKAEASVIPCETYEMVLAIADQGDAAYDSAVFLEGQSWKSEVDISNSFEPGSDIIPESATGDTISFGFDKVWPEAFPLHIRIEGSALNGIDYQALDSVTLVQSPAELAKFVVQPIPDSLKEGQEQVEFKFYSSNDCLLKSLTVFISDPDSLYHPVDSLMLPLGGNLTLAANPTFLSGKSWTFSNNTLQPIPQGSVLWVPMEAQVPVEYLNDASLLSSVCVSLQYPWDEDIDLYLVAPNQTFLELSTDNGGNGDNYTNTCFSRDATEDIRMGLPFAPASAAPFSGDFQPEGDWNDLLGTPVSGTWNLLLWKDKPGLNGNFFTCSMTFSGDQLGHFQYLWNTGDTTLSIQVDAPGIYTVTGHNQVCHFARQFVVKQGVLDAKEASSTFIPFQLAPNPGTGIVTLLADNSLKIKSIRVYTANGALVLTQMTAGVLSASELLPPGMYYVQLESETGVWVEKLLRW